MNSIYLIIYLLIITGIGIYSLLKIKNIKDFFIAGKKGSILSVTGSLLATILGSSAILGTVNLSHSIGWASSWLMISASIGLFLLYPLSKKINQFDIFTLPELLGKFYGKEAMILSSVIIPIAWIGIIAAQIIGAAKISSHFFSLSYSSSAILCGIIFIVYTILGGQISILKTDFIQSLLIFAGLFTILLFILDKSPDIKGLTTLTFPFNSKFSGFDLTILFLTYSSTFLVGPDIYSRLFCAKNARTASKSVLITAILLIPAGLILSFIGVYAVKHYPLVNPKTTSLLIHIATQVLPVWGVALISATLLSAVMSSADTTLLTAGTIISELFNTNMTKKNAINITRVFILIIGGLSILLALKITSIISSLLIALTVFSGAFIIPTLAGLFQYKTHKYKSLSAITAGGVIALCGKILTLSGKNGLGNIIIISAFLINALILFFPEKNKL